MSNLQDLLCKLDQFLTGKQPAATSHAHTFTHERVYSEELYLSGGYSSIFFDTDKKVLFLTTNSRPEICEKWLEARSLREAIEKEMSQWWMSEAPYKTEQQLLIEISDLISMTRPHIAIRIISTILQNLSKEVDSLYWENDHLKRKKEVESWKKK